MDSSSPLDRERAILRGKLDTTQEQIRSLQLTIAEDSRLQQILDHESLGGQVPGKSRDERDLRITQLQVQLVETLRDNELLRQVIASGSEVASPRLGHRTVSSTQLASASKSTLSSQQRRDVAEMLRRQENLRRSQVDSFEKQIQALERERDEAHHQLVEAQTRLADAISDLTRLEHVRLQDNRAAATECQLWEQERQLLKARIDELAEQLGTESPNFRHSHAPRVSEQEIGELCKHLGYGRQELNDSLHAWRDIPADAFEERMDELRSKLAEVRCETDRQVQHAAGTDETAYDWFLQTCEANTASRESLSAQIALLHTHIASMDQGTGTNGSRLELLLYNFAEFADCAFLRWHVARIFDKWARISANSTVMRDTFRHLFRGLGKGATRNVMNGLAKRMKTEATLDMFKVGLGLMLRIFRRPPFRAPFLAWARQTHRAKLLWRRASRLIFAAVNATLRKLMGGWHRLLFLKHRCTDLILRRKSVILFRFLQNFFRDWKHEVQGSSKAVTFSRRTRRSSRHTMLSTFFSRLQEYTYKHKGLKQGWKLLKVGRTFKALLRSFKGWLVMTMHSMHALLGLYDSSTTAAPDTGLIDTSLPHRRVWSFDLTMQLFQLLFCRYHGMKLERNEKICSKMVQAGFLLRIIRCWQNTIHGINFLNSINFSRSRMPLKSLQVSDTNSSELGTKRMYFVWKNLVANFESRLARTRNEKLCQRVLESWLYYKTRRNSLYRKQALLQLRWFKTPLYIIWTRWSGWTLHSLREKVLLRKLSQSFATGVRRKQASVLYAVLGAWKARRLRLLKNLQTKTVVDTRMFLHNKGVLRSAILQWRYAQYRAKVKALAEARLVKRTTRYALQKAFLHLNLNLKNMNARSDFLLRPWTRSIVNQAANEHFLFRVVDLNSQQARVNFLVHQSLNFWKHIAKKRVAILMRCHQSTYTWPMKFAFRAWAGFARIKCKIIRDLVRAHDRHAKSEYNAVLDTCYDMIKAWCCFTRIRRHAKKQLQNHMRHIVRVQLHRLFHFWGTYALTQHSLYSRARRHHALKYKRVLHSAVEYWGTYALTRHKLKSRARWHHTRKYKRVLCSAMEYWCVHTKLRCAISRKAAGFLDVRAMRVLRSAMEYWRQYACSLARLSRRTATVFYVHAMRVLRTAMEYWSAYVSSHAMLSRRAARFAYVHAMRVLGPVIEYWRQYAHSRANIARRADSFFEVHEKRRWLGTTVQFWQAFSVSRQIIANRAANFLDSGEAKHVKSLLSSAVEYWRMYADARLFISRSARLVFQKKQRRLMNEMYLIWVAYSRKKGRLALKGVILTQHTEIRSLLRAFDGLRHCKVSAEIASQYRLSLKNIQVDSCLGHAFRVWMRYMRHCAYRLAYVDARKQERIPRTLLKWAYRWWRVKVGRVQKLKVVLHNIEMINHHHLRRFIYKWNRRIRQGRVRAKAETKFITKTKRLTAKVHNYYFLCYTVVRMWEQHVSALFMNVNKRIVAVEDKLLRYCV
jgi:hypothetical protein